MKTINIRFMLFFVAACALYLPSSFAQEEVNHGGYIQGVGIHGGSSGIGAHYYQPLGEKFGLRAGVSFMPFNTKINGTYSGRKTHSDIKAHASNASLLFGYTPFAGKGGFFNSFGIELGGAYFFKLDGNFVTRLSDPYKYGDILVDPELVGTIKTSVDWKKTVNPYAGIAWSNIPLDSKFSANLNIGTYYLSKPSVTMDASGLLEENIGNKGQIENNIKDYRFLPRVEIGISYRLK